MALEPYLGKQKRKEFIVYDLEWYPNTYNVRLVGTFDGKTHRHYPSVQAFLNAEMTRSNRHKTFFAHAGGLADIQFVLEHIFHHSSPHVRVEAAFSGSAAILVWVEHAGNKWLFADSFSLLRDSLKKIGKSLGVEKGTSDGLGPYYCPNYPHCDHPDGSSGPTCVFYAPMAILTDYNDRDCLILWKAIDRFQTEILELGGELKPTIASTAMHLFRSRFLHRSIQTSDEINERAREAYISSRVEPYVKRCSRSKYFDFNSSFPFSMTKPLPGDYKGIGTYDKDDFLGLVRATVKIPEMSIPPVPMPMGLRRFFPTGEFTRWFDSADLELVEESGSQIVKIHEAMAFEPFDDMAEYVAVIYELRKNEKDEFRRLVYKYLLNALYGKTAQSEEKDSLVLRPSSLPECSGRCMKARYPDRKSLECDCVTMLMPGMFLVKTVKPSPNTHVPIAAHVTALSRALLTRALWACEAPSYCDTDSILTSSDLPTGNELGALKLEKIISRGTFLAPKFYQLYHAPDCPCGSCPDGGEVKAKGFPKMDDKTFQKLARGDSIAVERMLRLKELYTLGETKPRNGTHETSDGATHSGIKKRMHNLPDIVCSCKVCRAKPPVPKRCWEGNGSRPWNVKELEERL